MWLYYYDHASQGGLNWTNSSSGFVNWLKNGFFRYRCQPDSDWHRIHQIHISGALARPPAHRKASFPDYFCGHCPKKGRYLIDFHGALLLSLLPSFELWPGVTAVSHLFKFLWSAINLGWWEIDVLYLLVTFLKAPCIRNCRIKSEEWIHTVGL